MSSPMGFMSSLKDLRINIKKIKIMDKEITAEDAINLLNTSIFIDIREKDELDKGYISPSIHIPRGLLEFEIEKTVPNKNADIILYCSVGKRSLLAIKTLNDLGYMNVFSLAEGLEKWNALNYPLTIPENIFTREQLVRYSKQIILPEVGKEGQKKLINAKVLIVGVGGLGSPISYYLTAAGVGTIGLIDADIVSLSNLQRQILHSTDQIGHLKVNSAKERLNKINPDINIITYSEMLTDENAVEIIKNYDFVIDASDNFKTKYLVNDTCYFLNKPTIFGSIFKFEGQLGVFNVNEKSPCYRCVFPEPPSAKASPNCSEVGVMGVLAGVIGTLQATEAIKLILNKGELLSGSLLIYDSLFSQFTTLKVKKQENCPLCGKNTQIEKLQVLQITYEKSKKT